MQRKDSLLQDLNLPKPVALNGKELLLDVILICKRSNSREARELESLLYKPHFRALIDCHDKIGKVHEAPDLDTQPTVYPTYDMTGEAIRMVGIRKKPGEPLGLTVSILFSCRNTFSLAFNLVAS